MQVSFTPSVSSQHQKSSTNFGQINQAWVTKIVKNTSELNNGFHMEIGQRKIKKQDAIDTLREALNRLGKGYKTVIEAKITWASKYLTD